MIKKIIKHFRNRKLQKAKDEFNRGFDYAVKILLRDEEDEVPTLLSSYIDSSSNLTQFDKGIISAAYFFEAV